MSAKIPRDEPCAYRIRVQGRLGENWAEYFEGMSICCGAASDGSPVTELVGCLSDQAMLQGVLQKLYNLGFALISAEKNEPA